MHKVLCSNLKATTIAVAVLAFLTLLLLMPRDLGIFDEGIILTNAMRVMHGELIHRDFYALYGPAQFYVTAFVFWLTGNSFMAARVYDIVLRAIIVALFFFIVRRQCSAFIATFFTFICGLWLLAIGQYLFPIFPCILLALTSTYLVTRSTESAASRLIVFGAGACAGFAALFRYEAGFFLLIANTSSIAIFGFLFQPRDLRIRRVFLAVATYCAGTALIFLPAAIAFIASAPLKSFISDVIVYPAKYYAAERGLPFPNIDSIRSNVSDAVVYLPPFAACLLLLELVRRRIRHEPIDTGAVTPYLISFGITAVLLFLKGMVRVSAVHMMMAIVPALIVCAMLAGHWLQMRGPGWFAGVVMAAIVAVPTASISATLVAENLHKKDRFFVGWLIKRPKLAACEYGPHSGIARLSSDYARIATYVEARSKSDEKIVVALDRHDRVFANPMGLYFAVGRLPGTHWDEFDPGLVSRADIQTQIIGDLQQNHVRWVIRDASFDDMNEPNDSARSSGVRILDHYLEQNYRPVAASGKVAVWLKNDSIPIAYHPVFQCDAPQL